MNISIKGIPHPNIPYPIDISQIPQEILFHHILSQFTPLELDGPWRTCKSWRNLAEEHLQNYKNAIDKKITQIQEKVFKPVFEDKTLTRDFTNESTVFSMDLGDNNLGIFSLHAYIRCVAAVLTNKETIWENNSHFHRDFLGYGYNHVFFKYQGGFLAVNILTAKEYSIKVKQSDVTVFPLNEEQILIAAKETLGEELVLSLYDFIQGMTIRQILIPNCSWLRHTKTMWVVGNLFFFFTFDYKWLVFEIPSLEKVNLQTEGLYFSESRKHLFQLKNNLLHCYQIEKGEFIEKWPAIDLLKLETKNKTDLTNISKIDFVLLDSYPLIRFKYMRYLNKANGTSVPVPFYRYYNIESGRIFDASDCDRSSLDGECLLQRHGNSEHLRVALAKTIALDFDKILQGYSYSSLLRKGNIYFLARHLATQRMVIRKLLLS